METLPHICFSSSATIIIPILAIKGISELFGSGSAEAKIRSSDFNFHIKTNSPCEVRLNNHLLFCGYIVKIIKCFNKSFYYLEIKSIIDCIQPKEMKLYQAEVAMAIKKVVPKVNVVDLFSNHNKKNLLIKSGRTISIISKICQIYQVKYLYNHSSNTIFIYTKNTIPLLKQKVKSITMEFSKEKQLADRKIQIFNMTEKKQHLNTEYTVYTNCLWATCGQFITIGLKTLLISQIKIKDFTNILTCYNILQIKTDINSRSDISFFKYSAPNQDDQRSNCYSYGTLPGFIKLILFGGNHLDGLYVPFKHQSECLTISDTLVAEKGIGLGLRSKASHTDASHFSIQSLNTMGISCQETCIKLQHYNSLMIVAEKNITLHIPKVNHESTSQLVDFNCNTFTVTKTKKLSFNTKFYSLSANSTFTCRCSYMLIDVTNNFLSSFKQFNATFDQVHSHGESLQYQLNSFKLSTDNINFTIDHLYLNHSQGLLKTPTSSIKMNENRIIFTANQIIISAPVIFCSSKPPGITL